MVPVLLKRAPEGTWLIPNRASPVWFTTGLINVCPISVTKVPPKAGPVLGTNRTTWRGEMCRKRIPLVLYCCEFSESSSAPR